MSGVMTRFGATGKKIDSTQAPMSKAIQPDESVRSLNYDDSLQFYVNEIFFSIQGEGSRAGLPCIFVRLQGCSLRCSWCDTRYALDHHKDGEWMSAAMICERIRTLPCRFVEFTGGDPLEQRNIYPLLTKLCDEQYEVAIETGGHVDASYVDERVIRIIDVKCPGSLMNSLNHWKNLESLRSSDELKFVIADRADYDYALEILKSYSLEGRCAEILFSPVFAKCSAEELSNWILADGLSVRLQLQMHKFIWNPEKRGV